MSLDPAVRDAMLGAVPSLRAYAISLCRNVDRADDLVQETLLRAWAHLDSFEAGTNMSAWLFTILRNAFHSDYRKRRREVADSDGTYAATLKSQPEQNSHLQFEEFRAALGWYWSARPAFPMSKPPRSAAAQSAPSRAASIARVQGLRKSWPSKTPTISDPITNSGLFLPALTTANATHTERAARSEIIWQATSRSLPTRPAM
jgi:hypothetical protein